MEVVAEEEVAGVTSEVVEGAGDCSVYINNELEQGVAEGDGPKEEVEFEFAARGFGEPRTDDWGEEVEVDEGVHEPQYAVALGAEGDGGDGGEPVDLFAAEVFEG